jgi:hypothetical protein
MHQTAFGASQALNGAVTGNGVRRRLRRGLVKPWRFRISFMQLALGHSRCGYRSTSNARSFRGPHFGYVFFAATTSVSISSQILVGDVSGRDERSAAVAKPLPLEHELGAFLHGVRREARHAATVAKPTVKEVRGLGPVGVRDVSGLAPHGPS